MTGKAILITGCSTGIGYHCAHGMKSRGWRVLATARTDDDLKRLQAEGLESFYLDYRDEASIAACLQSVLSATGGRLDALFNNGAYGLLGAVEDIKTSDLREQFEANFFGWHDLTRQVIPVMRAQGGGRIIQCSSVLGIVSGKHRAPYAATKHAIEAMASSMRMELAPFNIHVARIRPGPIRSEFMATALKVLREKIDLTGTVHAKDYQASLARLEKGPKSSRFKLGPEAVLTKLIHATEAARPKAIYSVTIPTYIADAVRRLMPTASAERLFAKN